MAGTVEYVSAHTTHQHLPKHLHLFERTACITIHSHPPPLPTSSSLTMVAKTKPTTMTMRLLLLINFTLSTCLGFAPSMHNAASRLLAAPPLFLSSRGDDSESSRRQSRFEGMQREPTAADLAIIDDMITKLSDAKPYELPNAVSRAIRVVSSPQFFLRIAERADKASNAEEKEKLSALADNLVNTIRAVVSMTEDSLNERAKDVEKVVKAASEPESGEFLVPLSKERLDAMRIEMEGLEAEDLNEGFLTTVDSWMNKAHQVSVKFSC